MVTQDRPGGINSPMTVAEVEKTAGAPCVPALHGGTPYVKRPPATPAEGFARVAELVNAKSVMPEPSEYRGYAEDSQELPDMKFSAFVPPRPGPLNRSRPEIWVQPVEPVNPKTLVGRTKVPMLTVIPETALVRLARALQYGAFHAPRKDTTELGYGPKNWRDQQIEYLTYVDAAMRHLLAAADGEDIDPDTGELQVGHLEEAMASLAILIDARIQGTCIDNRHTLPVFRGVAGQMLRQMRGK
jgi:hypothetical protein